MYDVIVVGMGAAGCTAGAMLQFLDKSIIILEAMDRMGGRVHTENLGDSFVEMGAEWIHGKTKNSVHDCAKKANIELKHQELVHKVFTSDGHDGNSELLRELLKYAFSMVDQPPEEPEPLGHYITRRVKDYAMATHPELKDDQTFIDEFLRWMNLIIGNHESCDHWDDVSTLTKYEELDGHLQISWHKHGYKSLFEALMKQYRKGFQSLRYKLNTEVVNIKLPSVPSEFVEVSCKDGSFYYARAVIVTCSLGVLKERHASLFTPPLPEKKIKAINDLSIGVVDKVVFLFEEIWWPTDATCFAFLWRDQDLAAVPEEDKWTTMIFGASLSMANEKCLVIWTSGNEAKLVENLPEDEVRSKLMALLRKFMGKNLVIPEPVEMMRSAWHSNPFTRGSYSFDNIYTPQHPNARCDLAEPICDAGGNLRLMFAGEATDKTHFSTVHGAVDSGRREAVRYLKADFGLGLDMSY